LKNALNIYWLIVFLLVCLVGKTQTEQGLLPFSNKLLLNPSFAGLNKTESVWSNLVFASEPENILKHTFSVTFDTWSEKLQSGLGFYFYQGLQGNLNTNHTGTGFAFSKPIRRKDGELIPSFNLNYYVFTKQWFVYVLDGILDKKKDPYLLPGVDLMRYNILNPRLGLLWNSTVWSAGISGSYSYRHLPATLEELPHHSPFHLIVHASQKMRGKQNGLESRPFKASPELVVLLSEDLVLSRIGFRLEQVKNLMAMFVTNNFTGNIHGIGGIFGWRIEDINISITAGGAYSIPHKKPSFFGEASLGLVLPYKLFNEINPWAPAEDLY
jgi:hypothetical protein